MYRVIKVIGKNLYQWDIGRKVKINLKDGLVIDELHFSNIKSRKALVIEPYEEDGILVADIPNILLQEKEMIFVHCIQHHEDGDRSVCCVRLGVIPRKRPDDYIYDETETKDYGILEYKISELEKRIEQGLVDLDVTLTKEGKAADAKAVGDEISKLKQQIGDINLSELDFIKEVNDDSKEQSYSPIVASDLVTKEYVDNLIPTEDDALTIAIEMGLVCPVTNNNVIFTNDKKIIYTF